GAAIVPVQGVPDLTSAEAATFGDGRIGTRIRAYRKRLGLSQEVVAHCPGSLGPGREVEVGQLADGGVLALLAGLADGWHPGALRHSQDGLANGLDEVEAEREADLQFAQRVHEVVRGATGVGSG